MVVLLAQIDRDREIDLLVETPDGPHPVESR